MSDQNITQRIALKAVIVNDDNKVLMLREATTYEEGTNTGKYHSPGGRLEPGERWEDGLRREVREETGFTDLIIGRPLFIGEWHPVIKGVQNQIIALFIVCKVKNTQEIKLSDEHDNFVWLAQGETPKDGVIMEPEDKVLENYFKTANLDI